MVTGLLNPAIDIQCHALGNPGLLACAPLSSHSQESIAPPLRARENPLPPSTNFAEKSKKRTPNLQGGNTKLEASQRWEVAFIPTLASRKTSGASFLERRDFPAHLPRNFANLPQSCGKVAKAEREELNQAQTSAICVQF